jgi:hypothetical protein
MTKKKNRFFIFAGSLLKISVISREQEDRSAGWLMSREIGW